MAWADPAPALHIRSLPISPTCRRLDPHATTSRPATKPEPTRPRARPHGAWSASRGLPLRDTLAHTPVSSKIGDRVRSMDSGDEGRRPAAEPDPDVEVVQAIA